MFNYLGRELDKEIKFRDMFEVLDSEANRRNEDVLQKRKGPQTLTYYKHKEKWYLGLNISLEKNAVLSTIL